MADNGYVEALKNKLDELRSEISERQGRVRALNSELEDRQRLAEHLLELLKAENVGVDSVGIAGSGSNGVAETAYQELVKSKPRKALHYKDLAATLASRGAVIPGKDPAANLLAHMSRDGRFVRVAPGTYGLSEWGLTPAKRKRGRSRKRR